MKAFDENIKDIRKNKEVIDKIIKDDIPLEQNRDIVSGKIQRKMSNIIVSTEICFQILLSKQQKFKLNEDFTDSLRKLINTIVVPIQKINQDEEQFTILTPYLGSKYLELYKLTINKLNLLLETSGSNFSDAEINTILRSLANIKPYGFYNGEIKFLHRKDEEKYKASEDFFKSFFDQFFISVYQTVIILSFNRDNRIVQLLDHIIQQEFDRYYVKENDFLTLITALFVRNIELNNLKGLTDVTNTYMKYLIKSGDENDAPKINNRINPHILDI